MFRLQYFSLCGVIMKYLARSVFVITTITLYILLALNKEFDSKKNYFNLTTCSESSYRRGFGQKVISFSFYEHDSAGLETRTHNRSGLIYPDYFRGIKTNLELSSQYYPGWTVRLYHDIQHRDPLWLILQSYSHKYPNLDLCHVHHIPNIIFKGKH